MIFLKHKHPNASRLQGLHWTLECKIHNIHAGYLNTPIHMTKSTFTMSLEIIAVHHNCNATKQFSSNHHLKHKPTRPPKCLKPIACAHMHQGQMLIANGTTDDVAALITLDDNVFNFKKVSIQWWSHKRTCTQQKSWRMCSNRGNAVIMEASLY